MALTLLFGLVATGQVVLRKLDFVGEYPGMAGAIHVALTPHAGPRPQVVLLSIPLRIRKNAVLHFPHQAGHHREEAGGWDTR
jgi:hypothetical protein